MDRAAATERLKTDYKLFGDVMDNLAAEFDAKPDVKFSTFDKTTEERIDRAAYELRENGVSYWRGFYTDSNFLAKLSNICKTARKRADDLNVNRIEVTDPESGWVYYADRPSGRSRALFREAQITTPEITGLLQNLILQEVISRAFKTPSKAQAAIAESIIPTNAYDQQWWHIDRIKEQAKIMVLASDVTEANGPMKIIPGSHKLKGSRRLLDFSYFSGGIDFADVPSGLIRKHREAVQLCTGASGDVIFFNTSTFHANGRADEGERLTATTYFLSLSTPRNDFLDSVHPGYPI